MKQYTGITCRGCYLLGTACGKCEKCRDQRIEMDKINPQIPTMERVRVNLELTEKAKARLDWIKEEIDATSYSEVMRRALELYEERLEDRNEPVDDA